MPRWLQCHKLTALIEALQVELHGQYSVERFYALQRYSQYARRLRSLLVFLLTPLPCLLAIIVGDLLPLDPPNAGLEHNKVFWGRAYLGVWIFTHSFVQQFHHTLPMIPMTQAQIFGITAFVATGGLGCSYLTAMTIGFPIPFMMITCSPGWALLLVVSLMWAWGPFIKEHPEIMGDVKSCLNIFQVQMSLLLVYPAYSYVFTQLSASHQTAFSVVLQVIKLASKNALSKFICNAEDIQPEVVIFNAEAFHALFVSVCLQNSSSINTSLALMGVDLIVGCVSIYDVSKIVTRIHEIGDKIDRIRASGTPETQQSMESSSPVVDAEFQRHQIVERVLHLVETNQFVKQGTLVRVRAFNSFQSDKSVGVSESEIATGQIVQKKKKTLSERLRPKLPSFNRKKVVLCSFRMSSASWSPSTSSR